MDVYLKILKDKGFKITPLREAMLRVFLRKRTSLTAEELCKIVRARIPATGLQSVYRNLADFSAIGIMEEVFVDRRKAAYALCNGVATHHHHAVCRRCGSTVEVETCELGNVPERLRRAFTSIKKKTGFVVEGHSLRLEGLCHACRKKNGKR